MADKPSPSLHKKLLQIMADVGNIEKHGFNRHMNYQYHTAEDVFSGYRKAFIKAGITMQLSAVDMQRETVLQGDKEYSIINTILAITLTDCDTGESTTIQWFGQGHDPQDKGFSKSVTNGVKCWLLKTFMTPTDEGDTDGMASPVEQGTSRNHQRSADMSINSPAALLEHAKALGLKTPDIPHLLKMIQTVTGNDNWMWPSPRNTDEYTTVYSLLKNHADAPK